jgi:hypothetical protein
MLIPAAFVALSVRSSLADAGFDIHAIDRGSKVTE